MRLLIGQHDLADAARHILPVLDRSDPTRQAVTLDGGETITLTGAGPGGYSQVTLGGDVLEQGQATVNGLWLAAVAGALPAGEITVREDGERLRLDEEGAKATMAVMNGVGPVTLPDLPATVDLGGTLEPLARATVHAASPDPNRPVMTGVHIVGDGTRVTACATDRYRLGVWTGDLPLDGEAIIPAPWLTRVKTMTRLGFDDHWVVASDGTATDATVVIAGEFPDMDRIIPDKTNVEATVRFDRAALTDAIRGLKSLDFTGGVTGILFRRDDTGVTAMLTGADLDGDRHIDANCDGDGDELRLNAQYLLDALGALDGDEAVFYLPAGRKPILIEGSGPVRQVVSRMML